MRNDERRIDIALFDTLYQFRQVHRRLRHPEGKAAINRASKGDLVEQATIDSDDRNGSEIPATMNGLPQHIRAVRAHEGRNLDPVHHRICAGLGSGSVPTASQASAPPPFVSSWMRS